MSEEDLIRACWGLGVHVVYFPFEHAGAYVHSLKLIIIDSSQPPAEQKFTLAHEYVHARYGHDGYQSSHVEQRVDREAARLLISPAAYALAERLVGCHPVALAEELLVPAECVKAYQAGLENQLAV